MATVRGASQRSVPVCNAYLLVSQAIRRSSSYHLVLTQALDAVKKGRSSQNMVAAQDLVVARTPIHHNSSDPIHHNLSTKARPAGNRSNPTATCLL
jgi:hypothetical protein